MQNKEILKFKKIKKNFCVISIILLFIVFVFFLVTTCCKPVNTLDIVAISLFFGYAIFLIIAFAFLDKKRIALIKKYYGVVTQEDRYIAKQLLQEKKIINEYKGLVDKYEIENFDKILVILLKQLQKGHKVNTEPVYIFMDLFNAILKDNKEILNNEIQQFLTNAFDLFKRNLCDL